LFLNFPPSFTDTTFDFDIALLKVKSLDGSGIKFSDEVQPACLPRDDTPYTAGEKCHISGWGKTEHGKLARCKSLHEIIWLVWAITL